MNVKTRVAFHIGITLIIGVLLGALINRALIQRRIGRTINRLNPAALEQIYRDVLQPDAEKSRRVREIIDEHLRSISELRESYHNQMQSEFETTWEALDPLLTPEQKQLLLSRPFGPQDFFSEARRFFDPGQQGRMIDQTLAWLGEALDLTPGQSEEISRMLREPWWRKRKEDQPEFKPSSPPPRADRMRDTPHRIEQIKTMLRRDISSVLNESQKAEFDGLLNELMERMRPPFLDPSASPGWKQKPSRPIPRD